MDLAIIQEKIKSLPEDAEERKVLSAVLKRIDQRKLYRYRPYSWQQEFHDAGADNSQRLLMAANGVGKTLCGAVELAMHLTGRYPPWWKGRVFKKPILAWVGSISNQTQRDYTQPALMGPDG